MIATTESSAALAAAAAARCALAWRAGAGRQGARCAGQGLSRPTCSKPSRPTSRSSPATSRRSWRWSTKVMPYVELPAHDRLGGRPLLAPGHARAAEAPAGRIQDCCWCAPTRRLTRSATRPIELKPMRSQPATPKWWCAPRSVARAIRSSSTTGSRRPASVEDLRRQRAGRLAGRELPQQFAQEIGANGIDGLIAKLAERNKAAAAGGRRADDVRVADPSRADRCCFPPR